MEKVAAPDTQFLIPDAAMMEMFKSEHWKRTARESLLPLSEARERVSVTIGNGECLKAELGSGRPLAFADLISADATNWFRQVLAEISGGAHGPAFEQIDARIADANAYARASHLDHQANLRDLQALIPTLRSAYTPDFQKRMRAKQVGDDEYVTIVSFAATKVVNDKSMSLSAGSIEALMNARSYAARWVWLRVDTVTEWLAMGGTDSVKAERVTNSEIDRHYVVVGSYCDELLTKDGAMQEKDRKLRLALAIQHPWGISRD